MRGGESVTSGIISLVRGLEDRADAPIALRGGPLFVIVL
jgi:hypothetical protein